MTTTSTGPAPCCRPWSGAIRCGLDAGEIARAVVESVAENTVDAVVAPALWAAVAGAPGALGYRAVNTLDSMVGHRSPRYANYGWASARLDDVAGLGAGAAHRRCWSASCGRGRPGDLASRCATRLRRTRPRTPASRRPPLPPRSASGSGGREPLRRPDRGACGSRHGPAAGRRATSTPPSGSRGTSARRWPRLWSLIGLRAPGGRRGERCPRSRRRLPRWRRPGGRPRARASHPDSVLDLSQSLNPLAPDPVPVVARHLGAMRAYPDPAEATVGAGPDAMGVDRAAAAADQRRRRGDRARRRRAGRPGRRARSSGSTPAAAARGGARTHTARAACWPAPTRSPTSGTRPSSRWPRVGGRGATVAPWWGR